MSELLRSNGNYHATLICRTETIWLCNKRILVQVLGHLPNVNMFKLKLDVKIKKSESSQKKYIISQNTCKSTRRIEPERDK